MTKLAFPLNYFNQILTPKRAFLGRNSLTKFQLVIIFIFTTSLLLIPVTLNMVKSKSFDLIEIMPGTFNLIDESVLNGLKTSGLTAGKLETIETTYLNEGKTVGLNLSDAEVGSLENGISFNQTDMLLKDVSGYDFKVRYTKDFSPSQLTTVQDLKYAISSQWLIQNRAFVTFTFILMSGSLILVSNLILILGGALFIYLTKKSAFSSIKTYQESVNLMLNAIGLGSVFSLIVGLIYFDMTVVLSVQSLGLVMMLLAIFMKTRFNDEFATNYSPIKK